MKKEITGEDLQQLEERLEVAKVQSIVLKVGILRYDSQCGMRTHFDQEVGNIVIDSEREKAEKLLNSTLYSVDDVHLCNTIFRICVVVVAVVVTSVVD